MPHKDCTVQEGHTFEDQILEDSSDGRKYTGKKISGNPSVQNITEYIRFIEIDGEDENKEVIVNEPGKIVRVQGYIL